MNILSPLPFMRPVPGSSAYEFFHNKGQFAQSAVKNVLNFGIPSGLFDAAQSAKESAKAAAKAAYKPPYTSSLYSPSVDLSSQPESFDYLDAPWASAYQMSRETAYSEALNNTAYQRSVKDMQKAGLNPAVLFGAGNGSTAGVPAYVSSGLYPSASSGRSGSSGRSKSSDKLFSSSAYSVMSALGGIVGALATKSAGGYWIGTSLTQGAMSALSLLSNGAKYR